MQEARRTSRRGARLVDPRQIHIHTGTEPADEPGEAGKKVQKLEAQETARSQARDRALGKRAWNSKAKKGP